MSSTSKTPAPRSQFIKKLHALIENPTDSKSLHWISAEAFEISANDARARNALAPSFDFRSLGSFVRQLSYYGFKRLSDRRRSGERHTRAANFIIFSHPSGAFLKGDASRLNVIARKTRNRPEKRDSSSASKANGRRYSDISQESYDDVDGSQLGQVPNYLPDAPWQPVTNPFDHRYYDIHRNSQCTPMPPTTDYHHDSRDEVYASHTSNMGQWKLPSYPQPPSHAASYEVADLPEHTRANTSNADFKISSMSLASNAQSTPTSLRHLSSSPSFSESRTRFPKSPSHLYLPPTSLAFEAPGHGERLPSPNPYAHPYPTPEFSPTTQTQFHLGQYQYQEAHYQQL
ncbi:BQ2448_228 [Microbotryum intermedium]|uniref:BQ2448_228 protein n=1 Tax=Microbotryum intermedium TaxID=269621 RepID=A0A238F4Z8_9BASI|nr:BQ2448_228 [Microbotryum intermedium]